MSPPSCDPSLTSEPIPLLDLNANHGNFSIPQPIPAKPHALPGQHELFEDNDKAESEGLHWRPDMTSEEKAGRRRWLSVGRGRSGLRIVIVTGESPHSTSHTDNKE